MYSQMHSYTLLVTKHLVADITGKCCFTGWHQQRHPLGFVSCNMFLETLLRCHVFPADRADELRFVVIVSRVFIVQTQILADVITHLALNRRQATVLVPYVAIQSILEFVFLIAGVARIFVIVRIHLNNRTYVRFQIIFSVKLLLWTCK